MNRIQVLKAKQSESYVLNPKYTKNSLLIHKKSNLTTRYFTHSQYHSVKTCRTSSWYIGVRDQLSFGNETTVLLFQIESLRVLTFLHIYLSSPIGIDAQLPGCTIFIIFFWFRLCYEYLIVRLTDIQKFRFLFVIKNYCRCGL